MEALKFRLTKPYLSSEEAHAVQEVLNSGWLAEGKATEKFEKKLAKTVGAKYAVAVCNCTVAIELALKAHHVKGFVAIPDFTHPATAQAVLNAGAKPILYDVSSRTYNMTKPERMKYAPFFPENHLGASVPVSWAGNPIEEYPDSLIIEDAACSLGASKVGSKYTSCFSFHPRKLVTTGEGGAVTTNDLHIADRVRSLKAFGPDGGNYKFNDVAAAIGIIQLDKLEKIIERRRRMAKVYDDLLTNESSIITPRQTGGTYQTYAVRLRMRRRNWIISELARKGIETQIGTFALHLLPQFCNLHRIDKLTNSTLLYRRLLSLPMTYDLTEEDQKTVVSELCRCLNE
jgi:dTDP-4-amino-4,6-dideoxygalactose transaminase